MDKGLRFNHGKTRHELLPPYAQEQYALVYTKGAEKYDDRNWELGMRWSKVIASMKRHTLAIERGEDYDYDPNCHGCQQGNCTNHSGLLHSAHVMTNAAFLTEYYKIYPQGDDRPHRYLKMPKIGLDIDEVICDWIGGWRERFGESSDIVEGVGNWHWRYDVAEQYKSFTPEAMEEFYMSLKPKVKPEDIPFEPHCYITSRSVPVELTMRWLQRNGFPAVKVYSVGHGVSKVDVARESGIDWFVDDRFDNFVELNNAGICCFLMDMPHNRRYNVGYKRIYSLKDLI